MTDGWADEASGQTESVDPMTAATSEAPTGEATGGPTVAGAAGVAPEPAQEPPATESQSLEKPVAAEAEPVAFETQPSPEVDPSPTPPYVFPDPSPEDNLRVAHILLRMGSPLPARAHLETLAGANRLDRQGLLDLAESRWRTGDLPGAGEASAAYFEHGGGAALAYLIAAEATAATGRPSEAARFARRALEGLTLPLDAVFAGQPRSPIWPNDPADPGHQAGTLFAETAKDPTRGGRIGLTGGSRTPVETSMAAGQASSSGVGVMADQRAADASDRSREGRPDRSLWDEPGPAGETAPVAAAIDAPVWTGTSAEVAALDRTDDAKPAEASPDGPPVDPDGLDPALPDVGVELDGARDDLAAGNERAAAVRLAVVLRLRPALAPAVLELIGDLAGPDFDLLRGDAFRLVGHEAAAQRAFASAASALQDPSDPRSDE